MLPASIDHISIIGRNWPEKPNKPPFKGLKLFST